MGSLTATQVSGIQLIKEEELATVNTFVLFLTLINAVNLEIAPQIEFFIKKFTGQGPRLSWILHIATKLEKLLGGIDFELEELSGLPRYGRVPLIDISSK